MYFDVDIAIQPRSGDSYPVAIRAPGGEALGAFLFPEDPAFTELLAAFTGLSASEEQLLRLGRLLFDALFQGPARELIAAALAGQQVPCLRLRCDAEEGKVAELPWELLADERGPLARRGVAVVRTLEIAAKATAGPAPLPLRVLLSSAAADSATLAPVLSAIAAAFATLGEHVQVTVEPNLTVATLQRELRLGYHIWHFVGQGAQDQAKGGLLLSESAGSTKAVGAAQLANLLATSGLRLVVLDASASPRLATEPFRQLAPALLRTPTPAVLAIQLREGSSAIQTFAGALYRALAEGATLARSVADARQSTGTSGVADAQLLTRAPDAPLVSAPQPDMAGCIVVPSATAPGLPPTSCVRIHSTHGTLALPGVLPVLARRTQPDAPPAPPSPFFDREREQRQIQDAVATRRGTWVHGPPGSGASALVRQAASAAAQAMPDGVVALARTADATDQDDLAQEIFEQFYTSEPPTKLTPATARDHLGGLRAMLLMDRLAIAPNAHLALADTLAESAALVAAEVPAPASMLAVPIGPLPRKEATKLLGAEAEAEIDLSNVMFLDRICAALGDLPLGLELAGRLLRSGTHTLKQLVALAEEQRTEPDILARALKIMLRALDQGQTAALTALAQVGPGGATAEAVEAVSGTAGARQALRRLAELGLAEQRGERYHLASHSLRRAIERQIKPGDEKKRAASYYVAAAAAHAGDIAWLSDEAGNLLQAIELLLASGKAAEAGALARATQPMAVLRGRWGLWGKLATHAERAATATGDKALRAWAMHERGTRAGLLGNRAEAETALAAAHAIRAELGDAEGLAFSQHNLRHIGLTIATPPATTATPERGRGWYALGGVAVAALIVMFALLFWKNAPWAAAGMASTAAPQPSAAQATAAPTATITPTPTPTPLPTVTPAPTLTPTAVPLVCTAAADQINLRMGPGTRFRAIGMLGAGDTVTALGRSADGSWLAVQPGAGVAAWVSARGQLLACAVPIESIPIIGDTLPTATPAP
ncbi:CHAT domain-containing protein [Chloroflexia bacterium SDU3-3]|nr:CHAT domain-containing protein [Chloroflexia bacterium SDU3-3]